MNKDDPDFEILRAMALAYADAHRGRAVPMVMFEHMRPVLRVVREMEGRK